MHDTYERACKWVNTKVGPDREDYKRRREEERKEFLDKRRKYRKTKERLKELQISKGKRSKKYKKKKREMRKAKKKLEKTRSRYKREEFRRTMAFIGMDFTYEEVMVFSVFLGIVCFISTLFAFGSFAVYLELSKLEIITYGVPLITTLPAIVFIFTIEYPESLEKRMKSSTIGKQPQAINYMTMSMRVKPSLHRAVSFAAKNTSGPISNGLKQILWKVYIGDKPTLEESFLDFALKWGEWNEDLKRALYSVRASLLEKTQEGYKKSLERANEIMIQGTKKKVEDFSNSLKTPTTILFAIGVLLPLIIAAMLPMLSLIEIDFAAMGLGEGDPGDGASISLPILIVIMNVICPGATFFYAYHILGNKPGTRDLPVISHEGNKRFNLMVSLSIALAIALSITFLYDFLGPLDPIPYIFMVGIPISYYCLSTSYNQKKRRDRIREVEEEFPDAIFQLGSRIAEGTSVERAILKVSKSLKGTLTGDLFKKIISSLRIKHLSFRDVLFGDVGLLQEYPSQLIKTTMRTVVEISEKDPEEAGRTIMKIARYQQDLRDMEHEVKNQLSKSVEMMKATTLIFAPMIMGIVASLYFMLEEVFSELGTVQLVSPVSFTTILGVYLMMMAGIVTYYTKSIESGLDLIEFKYSLGKTLLISITIFSISFLIGKAAIVGF